MRNSCRICSNDTANTVHEAREMMFGDIFNGRSFTYFQCGSCETLQIAEIPDQETLSKAYSNGYYSFDNVSKNRRNGKNAIKRLLEKERDRFAILGKNSLGRILFKLKPNQGLRKGTAFLHQIPNQALTPDLRILDVGCGAGEMIHYLKDAGFENVYGVDPFIDKDIKYANGLEIHKKGLEEVSGEHDVVLMQHSFEHVPNPLATLRNISRVLRCGGWAVIRSPTVPCEAWEEYKTNWFQLDAPRHLHIPSPQAMDFLAAESDLALEEVIYDSTFHQFYRSELYRKGTPLIEHNKSYMSKFNIDGFKQRAERLNQEKRGDQAVFYLRRN